MKNGCLFIFAFLFCLGIKAQNNTDILFNAQMQGLLMDVTNNFENFKGYLTEEKDSTEIYTSKMTLPGTVKNEIRINKKASYYSALIATNLSAEAAEQQSLQWKQKLAGIIGKGYEEMPVHETENGVIKKGFWLLQDNYTTGILFIKNNNEANFKLQLFVAPIN